MWSSERWKSKRQPKRRFENLIALGAGPALYIANLKLAPKNGKSGAAQIVQDDMFLTHTLAERISGKSGTPYHPINTTFAATESNASTHTEF